MMKKLQNSKATLGHAHSKSHPFVQKTGLASFIFVHPTGGEMIHRKVNYRKAKRRNRRLAKKKRIGWGLNLDEVENGKYKDWYDLWQSKKFDEFADKVADFQRKQGFEEENIDGIIGLNTWTAMTGFGGAMAGIAKVKGKWKFSGGKYKWTTEETDLTSVNTCFLASYERIMRAYRLVKGERFIPPEKKVGRRNEFDVILGSLAGHMKDIEEKYRGSGAAGALVYAGLGEFVPESDIWSGALLPGAAIQVWGDKAGYEKLKAGTSVAGEMVYGTSFVFIKYDNSNKDKLYVRHFGGVDEIEKSDYEVWVAANPKLGEEEKETTRRFMPQMPLEIGIHPPK